MQVFTRNPRGGKARILKEKELEKLAEYRAQGLVVVCHAPYTINLASSSDDVRDFGKRTIAEDLQRMQQAMGGKRAGIFAAYAAAGGVGIGGS